MWFARRSLDGAIVSLRVRIRPNYVLVRWLLLMAVCAVLIKVGDSFSFLFWFVGADRSGFEILDMYMAMPFSSGVSEIHNDKISLTSKGPTYFGASLAFKSVGFIGQWIVSFPYFVSYAWPPFSMTQIIMTFLMLKCAGQMDAYGFVCLF